MDLLFDGEERMGHDDALQLLALCDNDAQRLCNTLPKGSVARKVFAHRANTSQFVLLKNHNLATIYAEIWNSDLRWRKA